VLPPPHLLIALPFCVAVLCAQESDLITLMDKNGIGTDATIAQHIKTIQDRVSGMLRCFCSQQRDRLVSGRC